MNHKFNRSTWNHGGWNSRSELGAQEAAGAIYRGFEFRLYFLVHRRIVELLGSSSDQWRLQSRWSLFREVFQAQLDAKALLGLDMTADRPKTIFASRYFISAPFGMMLRDEVAWFSRIKRIISKETDLRILRALLHYQHSFNSHRLRDILLLDKAKRNHTVSFLTTLGEIGAKGQEFMYLDNWLALQCNVDLLKLSLYFKSARQLRDVLNIGEEDREFVKRHWTCFENGMQSIITQRIHDIANLFPLYQNDRVMRPQWGALVPQIPKGHRLQSLFQHAPEISKALGEKIPDTLAGLLKVIPKHFLASCQLTRDELALYEGGQGHVKPNLSLVPAPGIIREGRYELRQLAHDDPRNITVGSEVMCCQHLGGAAASAVRDLWINPAAAIWAVFDRRSDQVVAQALVWRSRARSQQPRRRLGADLDGDVDDFSEVHFPLTLPHADFPRPNLGRGFIEARFPTMQFYPDYDEGLTNRLEYCNRIAVNSRILAIPHQRLGLETSPMNDEDYGRGETLVLDSVEALGGHRTPRIAGLFIRAADAAVGKLGVKWVYASGLSHGVGPVLKELALARLDRSGHAHDVQEKTEEAVGTILPSNALGIVYRDFNRRNSVFLASTWFPNALTRAEVL